MNNSLGKGYGILINCGKNLQDMWMSFAFWHSIKHYMPDCEVAVALHRDCISPYYWPNRCGVKYFQYRQNPLGILQNRNIFSNLNILTFSPFHMIVAPFDKDCMKPIDVKSSDSSSIVSYINGCGKFVCDSSIDIMAAPFGNAVKKYSNFNMSINEVKVLKYWETIFETYKAVS